MSYSRDPLFTVEEYFAVEAVSREKREYIDGRMYAMAGGTLEHGILCGNAANTLREGNCVVVQSDLKVRVNASAYVYPDVVVLCDPVERDPAFPKDTVTNPTLLVEVQSESTQDYDVGGKYDLYRTLPSLREYLVIASDKALVRHYWRNADDTWTQRDVIGLHSTLTLRSLPVTVTLATLYQQVLS